MTNFYSNPDQLNGQFFDNPIYLNQLVENTKLSNISNEFHQLPSVFKQHSSNSLTEKYPSLLDSVIQLSNQTNSIKNSEINFYTELDTTLEKSNTNKNQQKSQVALPTNNKAQTKHNQLDLSFQTRNLSLDQVINNQINQKKENRTNNKKLDKFFEKLDIKENKNGSKNEITLSPEKIANPINNNLKNRYEGIIEKKLDTLSIFKSYQIVKEIESGKTATEIDVDELDNNDPNQQIAAILTSNNFGFNRNYQTVENFEFSPFSIILMTLVTGVIAIQQKNVIVEVLFGENGISEQILNSLGLKKPKVSETDIFLHNRALKDAKTLAKLAQSVDNEKFSKHEFLLFAKIKFCLHHNQNEYQELKESIQLFKDAIKVQKSYQTISQIESMCQGIKQNEFYSYVYREMKTIDNLQTFHKRINSKLSEILPHVKTEEGKSNLQNYIQELSYVCQNEFMFNLFASFSQKQLEKFSILKSIAEVTDSLKGKDIIELKALTCLVMVHYDNFEILGEMINITGKKSSPDTYARIIQYIILEKRHQQSYDKFDQLMNAMRQWYPYYQSIVGLRDEYSQTEYTIPKDFTQEIPGIELYHKYKNYLTDKKTGYTYIDFGE